MVEMKLLLVLRSQRRVRIHDGDQLHLMLLRKRMQEPGHVPVFETDDGDPNRLLRLCVGHEAPRPEHQNKELCNTNNGTNEHT